MESLIKKIKGLEEDISSIEARISDTDRSIKQTEELIPSLETSLKDARLTLALTPSKANQTAVDDIRKRIDQAKNDLDDMTILAEALTGRQSKLDNELSDIHLEVRRQEGVRMCSKAQGLVDQYNQGIKLVREASIRGRILVDEVMQRGCKEELKAADPRMFDLLRAMLVCNFTLASFKNGVCSSPNVLRADDFDKQAIINELIN